MMQNNITFKTSSQKQLLSKIFNDFFCVPNLKKNLDKRLYEMIEIAAPFGHKFAHETCYGIRCFKAIYLNVVNC